MTDDYYGAGYDTADELAEALQGEFGPEEQAEAFDALGLERTDEGGGVDQEGWTREFLAQQQRLEGQVGYELSGAEIEKLARDQATSAGPPDLKESYDRLIHRDLSDADDRKAIMAETMVEDADYQDTAAGLQAEGEPIE